MRQFVYSIFDSASGVYDKPTFANSDAEIIRAFGDICASADHPIGMHPDDYTLMRIGEFDNNTGEIKPEVPVKLINGLESVATGQTVDQRQLDALDDIVKRNNGDAHAT